VAKALELSHSPPADFAGEQRPKAIPPEPNSLMTDVDAMLEKQILDIPQRQREPHVHHHNQTNDLGRKVEISERIGWFSWSGHGRCPTPMRSHFNQVHLP
jgi:hypothetical protein